MIIFVPIRYYWVKLRDAYTDEIEYDGPMGNRVDAEQYMAATNLVQGKWIADDIVPGTVDEPREDT